MQPSHGWHVTEVNQYGERAEVPHDLGGGGVACRKMGPGQNPSATRRGSSLGL